jgi:hypothetical protein
MLLVEAMEGIEEMVNNRIDELENQIEDEL